MVIGLLLESTADMQKAAAKKKKSGKICEYRSLSYCQMPELSGRDRLLDGRLCIGRDRFQRTDPVDPGDFGIFMHCYCYVRGCPEAGNEAGPKVWERLPLQKIYQDSSDPAAVRAAFQSGKTAA